MTIELIIRNWRITRGIPGGRHCWFDPTCEVVKLYRLPRSDSEEVGDLPERVDKGERTGYLDKVVSVSAVEDEDEGSAEERFEQGSFLEQEDDLPF